MPLNIVLAYTGLPLPGTGLPLPGSGLQKGTRKGRRHAHYCNDPNLKRAYNVSSYVPLARVQSYGHEEELRNVV